MKSRPPKDSRIILELNDVRKDFQGLEVLLGIDLAVRTGERHAIIGPNGAGKSTLFNLITGKYSLSSGRIVFQGEDVTGRQPHQLNRLGISRSFQITNLFNKMTVFENARNVILSKNGVRYSCLRLLAGMDRINSQSEELLNEIGLLDRKDIPVGDLSYGEQRALEIGLTVGTDPKLILLDEPTAGMSAEETREAVKLIEKVTSGKTLIIVEHDMDVVFTLADTVSVIYYGQVLCSGPPEEIKKDQRVKDAYLGEEED